MTSADKITADEAFEQLNGWDELAIKKSFGTEITGMRKTPFTFMRALVFVDFRRAGQTDREAYQSAMDMPAKGLAEHFAEDEAEPMPDEPVTESGKDG